MSLQYYGVFDSVTGEPKRFGTCDHIDVEAQASEPNEIAMVCPPEVAHTVQSAQRIYEAARAAPLPGETIGKFLTLADRPAFISPFKVEIVGAGIPIISPQITPIL